VENPDAYAGVHEEAELGDGEARAGAHPCHQDEQGEVANAEQDTGAELRARGAYTQLDRLASGESQGEGSTQDSQGEREIAHLGGNRGPLRRHEVTPPQDPRPACPQQAGPRRGGTPTGFSGRGWPRGRRTGLPGGAVPGTGDQQYPGHNGQEGDAQDGEPCFGEAVKLTEQQSAPGEGDNDVERRPCPGRSREPDRLRRLEHAVVARRPHHAASQRQPEAPPAEHQVGAAGQQSYPGEDGVADGHVKDPGARWRPGQELGQRNPGAQGGHQNDREQYGHGSPASWPCHQSWPPSSAQRLRRVLSTRQFILVERAYTTE
jgi:hypothetical protein